MPLRDHFHPPVSARHPWRPLHAGWPMTIAQHLFAKLPPGYASGPWLGVDPPVIIDSSRGRELPPSPAPPTHSTEADLSEQDEYEVQIYDDTYDRQLVAAVEIVSPRNKDRPESREAFAAKCAALLRQNVCVSIVDLVTTKQFNLYADTLADIAAADPSLGATPPHIYAVTLRPRKPPARGRKKGRAKVEVWFTPLEVGQPLPTIPLWLAEEVVVPLDLEPPYEDACRVLHIA